MTYLNNGEIIIRDIEDGEFDMSDIPDIDFEEGGTSKYKLEYFFNESKSNFQKTIVALYCGKIAGYVNVCIPGTKYQAQKCLDNSTFFYDLYILNKYRRMGLASKLVEVVETLAMGVSNELWCYVVASDAIAQSFYIKKSFARADNLYYCLGKAYDSIEDLISDQSYFEDDMAEYKIIKQIKK